MKILIFWDIYWRIWRNAFLKELPKLREEYNPDFVVVNVDNISSWRGPIEKHVKELEYAWVDIMTSWDHIFDNLDKISDYLDKSNSKLIRPANYFESSHFYIPWKWYKIVEKNWKKLLVIHLLSGSWMRDSVYNPFLRLEEILKIIPREEYDWVIVDFHKEYTSELYWMWMIFDWKLWFVFGTHTHIQSNDDLILDWWTWLMNDIWMSWSLHSVIWADLSSVKKRFLSWINKWKIEQSLDSRYVVNGVFVELENGRCIKIDKIRNVKK